MRITAVNSFHQSRAALNVRGNHLTADRVRRLRRRLCVADCQCFETYTRLFDARTGERIYHFDHGADGWILEFDKEAE